MSVEEAIASYDSEELNIKGVYPEQWKAGKSPDQSCNERDIEEGVKELKDIFEAADVDQDAILVFVG